MEFKKILLGSVICILQTLFFVSCKKNDIAGEPVVKLTDRVVNGVIPDNPVLLGRIPVIISSEFLTSQMQVANSVQSKRPVSNPRVPKNTNTGDIAAPSIFITSPVNGSSFNAGNTINILISASDNVGISKETFSVDGVLITTVNGTTSGFTWNTSGVSSGTHTLSVTATDAAGNTGYASMVVTINSTIISPPPSTSNAMQIAMPPVTTQGSEGSCVSFAIGYYMRSAEELNKNNSTSYSYTSNIVSPEYIFNLTRPDATCAGSTLISALNLLKSTGVCSWQSMPYSSSNGCSVMPDATQNAEAANYKIANYSTLYTSDKAAVKALLNAKHPLYISFNVDSYFYYAGPGFIWKSFSGTFYGQHAVVICGYDDAKNAYKVVNSWGSGWGESGYSWIDYDFLPQVTSMAVTITL